MLVLFELPTGYAIFKVIDEGKLKEADNIWKEFENPDKANEVLKLESFRRFKDMEDALQATTDVIDGKLGKTLKKILKKCIVPNVQEELAVADAKLGNLIKAKLEINCVSNNSIQELMRGIRSQLDSLIVELPKKEQASMTLGLAHSLSRYKLKFSADKIDTMIIQAISLLDDLDKELNNYIMRCREWYGWHFPELGKIVTDHTAFAKCLVTVGLRTNVASTDLTDILPEDTAAEVKEAAEVSMGTEITDIDIANIKLLASQIIEMTDYRTELSRYLQNRMVMLAPNLTVLLGELVSARLISRAGSLMNLAKYPASTVQILGAEKALFRALKTKKDTPKYGLIYHAQLVGQATGRAKGKMSRMLAAKAALACRVDAFGEDNSSELGIEHRAKLEQRLSFMQNAGAGKISGLAKQKAKFEKHSLKKDPENFQTGVPPQDSTIGLKKRKPKPEDKEDTEEGTPKAKRPKVEEIKDEPVEEAADGEVEMVTEKPKKKKKRKSETEAPVKAEDEEEVPQVSTTAVKPEDDEEADTSQTGKKKKKRKKKTSETE